MLSAAVVLAAMAAGASGADLAPAKSFPVPLAGGQTGSAVLLAQGKAWTMVVACPGVPPGTPPALMLYIVTADAALPPIPPPVPPAPVDPLEAAVAQWAAETVPAGVDRQADAVKLADSFSGVAAAILAGTLKAPLEIQAATTEANRAALGEHKAAWMPWAQKLSGYLQAESAAKRLETAEQHRVTWLSIAAGLRRVTP